MNEHRRVKAVISLSAISHNLNEMAKLLPEGCSILAVLKANGYGHGAVPIAKEIENRPELWGFAAATSGEAMELRKAGIRKPILILGVVFPEDYEVLAENEIRITVMEESAARAYAQAGNNVGKKVYVHAALDTGMTRIGFRDCEESAEDLVRIAGIPGIILEGLFTHFARADEISTAPAEEQLSRYCAFLDMLSKKGLTIPVRHCANSAAILRMPSAYLDLVRAGIALYGIYPSAEVERDKVHLEPALSWISHVSFVKDVEAGVPVSYGGTFVTSKKTRMATVPVGYGDGYPRSLSNKGWVLIKGKRAPICGRVCMDQMMVDVSEIPDVRAGDQVVLLGRDGGEIITADLLGELSGRFPYELVCDISLRVPRIYTSAGLDESPAG